MKGLARSFTTPWRHAASAFARQVALTALALCALGNAATAACNDWQPGFELIGFDARVADLVRVGSVIYAGGEFVYVNGVQVNHIAKWDGTRWSPLGTGTDGSVAAPVP